MTLQELKDRQAYLESIIAQTTNQVHVLHGQKGEVEHHIQLELKKIADAEAAALANPDEVIVE